MVRVPAVAVVAPETVTAPPLEMTLRTLAPVTVVAVSIVEEPSIQKQVSRYT